MKEDLESSSASLRDVSRQPVQEPVVGCHEPLSIEFMKLLGTILVDLGIPSIETWWRQLRDSCGYVCCLGMGCLADEGRIEWFVGDTCHTIKEVVQSLAKKAILFMQAFYRFVIKDTSYSQMYFTEVQCIVERDNYLALKEKGRSEEISASAQVVLHVDGCATPTGFDYEIPAATIPPPLVKPKVTHVSKASSSTRNIVLVWDTLASIYKVLGIE